VVIPVRNRLLLLREALESVRAQTLPPAEIVVVDDGSTDGTGEADLGPGVRLVRQEHRGPSAARNRGVREADADLVAFLDSDDRWAPEKLAAQVPRFTDPEVVLSYAREEARDEDDAPVHVRPDRLPAGDVLRALAAENFVPTSTVVARREALLAAGGFDEEMTHAEDWDLWLRLAERGRFAPVEEVLSLYRFHDDQLIGDHVALSRGKIRVMEKALARLGDEGAVGRVLRRNLADLVLRLGRRLLKAGEREAAFRTLVRAKGLTPLSGLRAGWLLLTARRREPSP
jgi:glycosyltransferase involved in cell wall biosynthesis